MSVEYRADRLWPEPVSDITLDEAMSSFRLPEPRPGRPLVAINMAEKIGLRTQRNGPLATSLVRCVASTPTRHASPIANCAHSVVATPTV